LEKLAALKMSLQQLIVNLLLQQMILVNSDMYCHEDIFSKPQVILIADDGTLRLAVGFLF